MLPPFLSAVLGPFRRVAGSRPARYTRCFMKSLAQMAGRVILAAVPTLGAGCGLLRGAATSSLAPMASRMADAMKEESDPDLVRDGGPALIMMLDGMAAAAPGNPDLRLASASARVGYAAVFFDVADADRARAMFVRARDDGLAALSADRRFREALDGSIDDFEAAVQVMDRSKVALLYVTANAWIGWILNSPGSVEAISQIGRPVAMMRRVLDLDPAHDNGGAHLFFGIYYSVQPRGAGRDLEAARRHFDEAFALAGANALLPRVAFAEYYARYAFDRDLFDSTLRGILEFRNDPPELRLMNEVARRRAAALLPMADEWF